MRIGNDIVKMQYGWSILPVCYTFGAVLMTRAQVLYGGIPWLGEAFYWVGFAMILASFISFQRAIYEQAKAIAELRKRLDEQAPALDLGRLPGT